MEAGNWEELDFLLKAAGIPTDKVMGIGLDSEDESEDDAVPSPRTFHENLKMTVMGEELKFPFLDLREFEVYGTRDLEDELITPPPFMDMGPMLQPVSITPEEVEEVRQNLAQMLEAVRKEEESKKSVDQGNIKEEQLSLPPTPSKEDSSEMSASVGASQDLGRAKKRQRESEGGDDNDVVTPPTTSPKIPDEIESSLVIISSGSSTDFMEQDSDAVSDVIDLTQQP